MYVSTFRMESVLALAILALSLPMPRSLVNGQAFASIPYTPKTRNSQEDVIIVPGGCLTYSITTAGYLGQCLADPSYKLLVSFPT
jgi:hypothetical protein